jgi:hypothetical protein
MIWGIEGDVQGSAGARLEVELGPFTGEPDNGEFQAVRAGSTRFWLAMVRSLCATR